MDPAQYTYNLTDLEAFCFNDAAEISRFMEQYILSAGNDLDQLMKAWAANDLATVKEKAHKMKSILALIQAHPHTELAELLFSGDDALVRDEKIPERFRASMLHMFEHLEMKYTR